MEVLALSALFVLICVIGFILSHRKQKDIPILTETVTVQARDFRLRDKRSILAASQWSDVDLFIDVDSERVDAITYTVTFARKSGDLLKLDVSGDEYAALREGDVGTLTFQGTKYQGFVKE